MLACLQCFTSTCLPGHSSTGASPMLACWWRGSGSPPASSRRPRQPHPRRPRRPSARREVPRRRNASPGRPPGEWRAIFCGLLDRDTCCVTRVPRLSVPSPAVVCRWRGSGSRPASSRRCRQPHPRRPRRPSARREVPRRRNAIPAARTTAVQMVSDGRLFCGLLDRDACRVTRVSWLSVPSPGGGVPVAGERLAARQQPAAPPTPSASTSTPECAPRSAPTPKRNPPAARTTAVQMVSGGRYFAVS